jgi:hypothetical protein
MSYHVFTRTFWKDNPEWPDGREPCLGKKHTIAEHVETEDEARRLCREYNSTHPPGRLSRKAEYEET